MASSWQSLHNKAGVNDEVRVTLESVKSYDIKLNVHIIVDHKTLAVAVYPVFLVHNILGSTRDIGFGPNGRGVCRFLQHSSSLAM